MKRLVYLLIAFLLIFASLPLSATKASVVDQDLLMKVKLKNYLGNQTSLTLTATGDYITTDGKTLHKGTESVKVKVESDQLVVYKGSDVVGKYDQLSLSPVNPDSLLSINNRPYHGSLEFTVESNKYVRPINFIYIEEYLMGVVPMEMPALWHMEALKSQTIAARTYALRHQSKVIDDTISYQVYGGAEGHVNSNKAIAETAGMVLKYNNSLIDAFFSSSNGGVTELNSNAWAGSSRVPFFQIKEDQFDPKTEWSITIDKQQIDLTEKKLSKSDKWWTSVKEKDTSIVPNIKNWLNNNGYMNKDIKITDIPVLSLGDKTSGGRVTKGSIQFQFYVKDLVDKKGALVLQTIQLTDVAASKVRAIVGIDKIKSYLVDESSNTSKTILLKGRGYGHGVGLSQFGAQNRAKAGQTYEDILQFYYPGAVLVKEYSKVVKDSVASANDDKKVVPAEKISSITAKANYSTEKAKIGYIISENATVSVTVENSKGKVIAIPLKQKSYKKGSKSTSWNFSKSSDGTYKVTIAATDSNKKTKIVTKTLKLKKTKGKVKASVLNLREQKSTSSKTIGKLKKNQTITILTKEVSWYKIKTSTQTGYVAAKYVTVTK